MTVCNASGYAEYETWRPVVEVPQVRLLWTTHLHFVPRLLPVAFEHLLDVVRAIGDEFGFGCGGADRQCQCIWPSVHWSDGFFWALAPGVPR